MNLYEVYKTDANKEAEEGIKVDLPGGASISLRRAGGGNGLFDRAMDTVMKPYRRQLQMGTLDDGKADELMARVYARAVVIDWQGVTDEKGKKLDCTEENVVKLFTDLPDLFEDIKAQASNMANFRRQEQEEVEGNSES